MTTRRQVSKLNQPFPAGSCVARSRFCFAIIFVLPSRGRGRVFACCGSVAVADGEVPEFLASRPDLKRFSQPQRELVEHIFARHKHFDAGELIEDLKAAGASVSRATVYRTLKLLVDAGLLRRIEVGPRTLFDHDYGYPAHDHFVCTSVER